MSIRTHLTLDDFAKSDAYFNSMLNPQDPALEAALQNSRANGLPEIAVSITQGKFLKITAQSIKAKRILEVGTLAGYSSIWFARALPDDGKLITLELYDEYAKVARENLDHAGLSSKVDVKIGPALDTLKTLTPDEPFDLVFIDADWTNMPNYFKEAKRLTRKGAIIICDNVNRNGQTALQPENNSTYTGQLPHHFSPTDEGVKAIRSLVEQLKDDKEVEATVLGLAQAKSFDGMLYAIKL
ncbi:O-methyltransferase family 3 protein [Fomitiporia mediterranea MF3/22]|uniref:O-methyltransferase family 3 protein n=1 Tax=Fomitiporia mediterranea (strain MF3/22) TaxID=694068 RepID=R7SJ92_FOMME|nr:O-methyltransferase family 3 protein [Fomitiporia mediterranea MF3/22]EJC97679.1 O-methyltransferase family 3 protein [Fomitiporia mediterranea MF3/22]